MTMILEQLTQALGRDIVYPGVEADPRYWRDWTTQDTVVPIAVVLPRTVGDVSQTLKLCNDAGVAVVTQGGRTGLVGGAQPQADGIVLALDRMAATPDIDASAKVAVVQAGVTLESLQVAAGAHGLTFPVDFGARGSCQAGGFIATNAGGNRAFRQGMVRANVLGLEVVLPDGTVIDAMNRSLKNNTGFDTKQMFIGSEGTLGVVTRAVLRLIADSPAKVCALLSVEDVPAAVAVLRRCEAAIPGLVACEIMWPEYAKFGRDVTGVDPLNGGLGDNILLLVEAIGADAESLEAQFSATLEDLFECELVKDGTVAQSETQRDNFWKLREANEALFTRFPLLMSFDVSIAPDHMSDLINRINAGLRGIEPSLEMLWFGHLGDSNLHLAVAGKTTNSDLHGSIKSVVYEQIEALLGSISAEHGIGRDKLPFLGFTRSEAEIGLMQVFKRTIDPRGIMNPGKVIL